MFFPRKILQPQIIKRSFDEVEKECITVRIGEREYEACAVASSKFWGNSKPGAYGAGLGRTDDDPYKPARVGLLGQMAFGKLTGLPVDIEYRQGGDSQDVLFTNYKFDIKCAMRYRSDILIYHTNEWGRKIPLDKDIYVCGYLERENYAINEAVVHMVGFALQKDILTCEVEPGRKGKGHLNYVLQMKKLRPIIELIGAIEATTK